jgi:puromycin-sensitive aminopeptidase
MACDRPFVEQKSASVILGFMLLSLQIKPASEFRMISLARYAITLVFASLSTIVVAATGRLPAGVTPIHYDLRINPDAQKLSFTGSGTILIKVNAPTATITLNAADLSIDKALLDGLAANAIKLNPKAQTVTISFARPVSIGQHKLSFEWKGKIYQSAAGLFAIDYKTVDGADARMLATQFEAPDARRFAPMFDEPGMKATFTLTALSPKGQTAYSNMPVTSKVDTPEGTLWSFAKSPKMSSYLLFLGIGDIERKTVMAGKTEIGIITRRGVVDQGDYALESGKRLLAYFDDYFGTPYPLPKLDMIAAPGSSQFFGAMENWGAILYFERTVLIDPKLTTESQKQDVFGTVAHEIAHQWFGNLVTMAWWDDLWLNEGFASWMASKVANDLNPEWRTLTQSLAFDRQGAMNLDARSSTHPIIRKINTVEEISQAFDSITYRKGEAVIRMLEASLGAEVFRAGVRNYMAKHAYGNTVTNDLWAELSATSGKPVANIMAGFTLQGGVPLIRVTSPRCINGDSRVQVSQARFGLDPASRGARLWQVPARISTGEAISDVIIKGAKPINVTIKGCRPLIVNAGQSAYFRTLYSPAHFETLRINFGDLALDDQVGLLADSFALANGGYTSIERYLALIASLKADAPPLVWTLASQQLESINDRLRGAPEQAPFQARASALLRPVFDRIGWEAEAGDAPAVAQLRETIIPLLGRFGDPAVREKARSYAETSFASPEIISGAVRLAALPVASYAADAKAWDALHERAKAEKSPVAKRLYYGYLGSVADAGLARRALAIALTDEAPVPMRASIIRAVANEHPEIAFKWAVANAKAVNAFLEESSRTSFIPELASGATDPKIADAVMAYANERLPAEARGDAITAASLVRYRADVRAAQSTAIGTWARGSK